MTVWVMTKIQSDCYGMTSESACAFSSFKAANGNMFEDWVLAYGGRPDKDDPDVDKFWEGQAAPSETDWEASIRFRDKSMVDWRIHECPVEDGGKE